MENMFVYGSLCKSSVSSVILGRSVETTEDFLDDYDNVEHSYFKVYPTIKKKAGKRVVGEIFEGEAEDEGIINEFKRKVGLGDFKPGTMFMDLMHEQYPLGDPKYIEELKKDLEETGREPTGIENLAMYFPEAMALVGGGKMKFPSKIMKTPFSPWNVFTPHHVLPYSQKTPVGIYRDIQESIPKFEKEKEMEIPILFTVDREGNKIQ